MSNRKIIITEVAPRDGWQGLNDFIPVDKKIELISKIIDSGIKSIQAGSFVSLKSIPQMLNVKDVFTNLLGKYKDVRFFALVPNFYGANSAYEVGVRNIATVISVSESHNKSNINSTIDKSVENLREIRQSFQDINLTLDVATAFGCPFEGITTKDKLLSFLDKVLKVNIDTINLCDTIGIAYPTQVENIIYSVKKEYPNIPIEIHVHDTRNMGMLNTWVAIQCGIDRVQTSLGGLGRCPFAPGASGNTATEDLVYMLNKCDYETGVDFEKLIEAAKYMHSNVSMGYTMAEKILAKSANLEYVNAGNIITAKVDCAMLDDILCPKILNEEFEKLGSKIMDKDKVVLISDHYAPSATINQADIVAYTREWGKKHGLENYFEGIGPCHQILAENGFSLPSSLQVGTDSHTCTAGAFGCFGTGIGSTEMIGVLATGSIWLLVPQSILITWNGKLQNGVMAKDIILKVIGDIGHAGGTYMAMEFNGSTIKYLNMDERMCVTNMVIEAGAKSGLIESDDKTDEYLKEHGCNKSYEITVSDADANYNQKLIYSAEKLSPQVACPHNVDNVHSIEDVKGTVMQRAYIGSCTGGRLTDLKISAKILKGRKVSKDCKLLVSPASERIWRQAADIGILGDLAESGATILAPTCGACLGLHSGLLGRGEHCISSTNRNFKGRMGSKDSFIYLASPATVAASAIEGRIVDCREYFLD